MTPHDPRRDAEAVIQQFVRYQGAHGYGLTSDEELAELRQLITSALDHAVAQAWQAAAQELRSIGCDGSEGACRSVHTLAGTRAMEHGANCPMALADDFLARGRGVSE